MSSSTLSRFHSILSGAVSELGDLVAPEPGQTLMHQRFNMVYTSTGADSACYSTWDANVYGSFPKDIYVWLGRDKEGKAELLKMLSVSQVKTLANDILDVYSRIIHNNYNKFGDFTESNIAKWQRMTVDILCKKYKPALDEHNQALAATGMAMLATVM